MEALYHFLFKLFLAIPILAILNNTFLNNFARTQKVVNTTIYTILSLMSVYLLISYNTYGVYNFQVFNIGQNIPIVFSVNAFNILFGFFIILIMLFTNIIFQKSFNLLNLSDKYILYNKPLSYLYFLYILISFSHNIIIAIMLSMLILFYSLFLITNPDLKDLRKKYFPIAFLSLISTIIFFVMMAVYFIRNGNILFTLPKLNSINAIPAYWIAIILFLLIFVNFIAPIYSLFKEKLYYEDLLPLFIICIIPFVFINTFLFFKIIYFIFYNNFNNIGLYFYYAGFFAVGLFLISCFFLLKYIKESDNNIKFVLLFNISNFLIFLSQILFINSEQELAILLSYFLLMITSITLNILSYSGTLFLLFNSGIVNTNILYKNSKIELNFYIFCTLCPILINFISFFNLDFHNFNILYLINLGEIFIIFCIFIVYTFLNTSIKLKPNAKKPRDLLPIEKIDFFIFQIIFLFLLLLFLLLKNPFVRFLIFKK